MYVECKNEEEKYLAISNIYTIPVGNSMFFCHTKRSASSLASRLKQDGHQVALLTGEGSHSSVFFFSSSFFTTFLFFSFLWK